MIEMNNLISDIQNIALHDGTTCAISITESKKIVNRVLDEVEERITNISAYKLYSEGALFKVESIKEINSIREEL
jgi:histidinol dehydrogenase